MLKEGSCLDRLSVLTQCSGFSLIPSPSTLRPGSASHGAPGPLRGVPGLPVGFLHQEGGANSPGCIGFPASFSLSGCRMTLSALSWSGYLCLLMVPPPRLWLSLGTERPVLFLHPVLLSLYTTCSDPPGTEGWEATGKQLWGSQGEPTRWRGFAWFFPGPLPLFSTDLGGFPIHFVLYQLLLHFWSVSPLLCDLSALTPLLWGKAAVMQTAARCTPVRSTCDSGETAKQMHDSHVIVFLFKPEIIRVVRLSKKSKCFYGGF